MRFTILALSFLTSCYILQAQNENLGLFREKVIDKNSKQPLSYVNISIKKADKVISGEITADNKNCAVKNIAFDNYTVERMHTGFKTQTLALSLTLQNKCGILNTVSFEQEAGNIPYRQEGVLYWETRTLYVGFSLMFGSGKTV